MQQPDSGVSPRDRFLTVYGRRPVLEALTEPALEVDKVVLADNARGPQVDEILHAAETGDVPVQRATAQRVKVLAGNGKQDQGALADVVAPHMRPLRDALRAGAPLRTVLLLDGITTPANVGMILRTATAAGVDGIVVPRRGVASLDPLVVKASAGVAFHAPILRCSDPGEAAELLTDAGYPLFGLAGGEGRPLFEAELPDPAVFAFGGENAGLGEAVRERVTGWLSIPMSGPVESLNVSVAAGVLCYDLLRRHGNGTVSA